MNIEPILHTPLAIRIHLAAIVPALAIGTWQVFFSVKGARFHRIFGFAYLSLMMVAATSAFFIRSIGHGKLSPIHLFIPVTFFSVFAAIWYVRRGRINGHRWAMLGLYFGGLLLAGALTFLPGRIMHQVFFG
jgi:uncharacterized membrane protein